MNSFFKHFESINHTIEYDKHFLLSNFLLELSHKINLFSVCSLICIGLVSNIAIVSVLFHKQNSNPNPDNEKLFHATSIRSTAPGNKKYNLPFICLLINDNIYLIFHFLDETLKTYEDIYMKSLVGMLNKNEFMCRFFAYLRNSLRFSSTYLIVGLILHHLFSLVVTKYKPKRLDLKIFLFLWLIAFAINIWIPFFFSLHNHDDHKILCDIVGRLRRTYFRVNLVYILLTMFLPCLIILIVNPIIKNIANKNKIHQHSSAKKASFRTNRYRRRRCGRFRSSIKLSKISSDINACIQPKQLRSSLSPAKNSLVTKQNVHTVALTVIEREKETETDIAADLLGQSVRKEPMNKKKTVSLNMVPVIINIPSNLPSENETKEKRYKKLLKFVSYMHVIFNTPFIIVWLAYFFKMSFYGLDSSSENYMFALIKLTEIFSVFNYSFKIYVAWFLQ